MKRIVVLGVGFAGMWATLAARHRVAAARGQDEAVDIAIVTPDPSLVLKAQLYERESATMQVDLTPMFAITGILGLASGIACAERRVAFSYLGRCDTLTYDRLVLAAGSRGEVPPIPGLEFDFDLVLASAGGTVAETVIVIGGVFLGIEIASELASRVRGQGLSGKAVRIVILDQCPVVAPSLGEEARRVVAAGLCDAGIECVLSATVKEIDSTGMRLSTGQFLPASMVVWTGVRANALTRQVAGTPDSSGRVMVNGEAKAVKRMLNSQAIYPPQPSVPQRWMPRLSSAGRMRPEPGLPW